MKRRKSFLRVLVLCIGILAITIPTYGSTYTVTISGITADMGVLTAEVWVPVATDFVLTSFTAGNVYTIGIPGWDYAPNPPAVSDDPTYGKVFKFGIYDWSLLAPVSPVPLTDGILFSIEYSGGLTALNSSTDYISFIGDQELFNNTIMIVSSDVNGASFNAAVPIPGALWLLGSGLIGIIGIRRKLAN